MSTSGGSGGASLLSESGSLAADVSLAQNTLTTILTTASLAVGKWLVSVSLPFETTSTNQSLDVETVVGTATATLSGVSATSVGYVTAIANGAILDVTLSFIATVTAAGTLVIQGEMTGSATAATILHTSKTQGYANAAGYTAIKIE